MNTTPMPKFSITVQHLGPIIALDGELTKHAQNLIFARNGTGKSFLSRAFRYLDLTSQDRDISNAADNLVSDESADGKGKFSFSRGQNVKGSLQLEKNTNNILPNIVDTIFHVFSEDFVHEELRERSYKIDGEIESQISVDSENIQLKAAQEDLETMLASEQIAASALRTKYETEKLTELCGKASVNKQLTEYKTLSLDALLEHCTEKPASPEKSFTSLLKDLDNLKALPAEPTYPNLLNLIRDDDIDFGMLETSLQRLTSPSSVSEEFKGKIDAYHSFLKTGSQIIQDEHRSTCPLCEQSITDSGPKLIIDTYIAYFNDEEEKHKSELRGFLSKLNQRETELKEVKAQLTQQKSRYDALKYFIPSKKDSEIDEAERQFTHAIATITSFKDSIQKKISALSIQHTVPSSNLTAHIEGINMVISKNNSKVSELNKAIEKSDEERKTLQRKGCKVFDCEFAITNWDSIVDLRLLENNVKNKRDELTALEKSSPPTSARIRVAETFELLLKQFFASKYVFDKENFTLKRGTYHMKRGPHRTLSDGEKTAIAFCYFIACIHRKVTSNSDYKKLFLVFDDPVTSMSYDFIFTIAQTLKNLSISKNGEIAIDPSKINSSGYMRPELLILTHSSYFFNISRTNKVVKKDATFSLSNDGATHILTHLSSYLSPFEQQLSHIYKIANGDQPDHGTGNAIRSVLEAVGRFCRPDKSQSAENFIAYLAGEENFIIKSTLINSLSHGTYYEEAPHSDDLKLACEEAIKVVEKFAPGQIEIIKPVLIAGAPPKSS